MPVPELSVLWVVSLVRLAVLVGLSELRPFYWDQERPRLLPERLAVVLVVVVLQQVVATRDEPVLVVVVEVVAAAVDVELLVTFVAFQSPVRA